MPQAPRVAFFGGSFDPPHRGHLAVARAARAALALDTVLFAPVGAQPLKPRGSTASFADRVAMTRLAIAGEPSFALSLADAPSAAPDYAPNYTIDTLHALRATLPAEAQLFCLMGADSFLGLRRWHRGAEIPFAATLVVAARPGQPLRHLAAVLPAGLTLAALPEPVAAGAIDLRRGLLRNTAGAAAAFYLLPDLHIDLSASELRRQVRSPRHHRDLPPAVFRYIAAHRLYRDPPGPDPQSPVPKSLFPEPLPLVPATMSHGDSIHRMTPNSAHDQTRILVQAAARACEAKKGEDTRILELDPIDSGLADFFLITSARNSRQTQAIADEIELSLKRQFGVYPNSVEGRRQGEWILLDYVDFVVHVFLVERRAFYNIERLRKSARPLTPAEFDAELTAALAARTRATRTRSATSKAPVKKSAKPAAKKVAKKTAKAAAAKSAAKAARKTIARPRPVASSAAKKSAGKAARTRPARKK